MARTRRMRKGWLAPRPTPVPGDILACLHELGIQISNVVADEANGRCAMHYERTGKDDKHPSWSCNTESGVFNCYSCGWRGPFVKLVADVLGISWDDAVVWVRKRGGIDRVNKILGRGEYINELLPEREVPDITEADLALYTLPPREAREGRGITKTSCEKYGILWDPTRDMWIFPIRDTNGKLMGWQEKNARYFRNKPFSVEKGKTIFGFHLLPPGGTAVLIESPSDCARVLSVGVTEAVAVSSFGAEVTDAQMQLLFERCNRIILGLDNDGPGRKAMREIKDRYPGMGRRLSFYNYGRSGVKDPGEQSGAEIRFGVERALSPLRVRLVA